jgi:hypothetical protein
MTCVSADDIVAGWVRTQTICESASGSSQVLVAFPWFLAVLLEPVRLACLIPVTRLCTAQSSCRLLGKGAVERSHVCPVPVPAHTYQSWFGLSLKSHGKGCLGFDPQRESFDPLRV